MDVTVQVEVLRKHSTHVEKLVTQLTDTLTHLAHVLSAPQRPTDVEAAGLFKECAELESTLRAETGLLWRRLRLFLANTKPGPDSP
jgi:hypothetical protein